MTGSCKRDNEPPVPLDAGNFLTRRKPVSFSTRTLIYGVSTERPEQARHNHIGSYHANPKNVYPISSYGGQPQLLVSVIYHLQICDTEFCALLSPSNS